MLAIAGIVAGAAAITISKFGDTTTDTQATYALNNASDAIATAAEQQGTIAIISVMVIIISLIAGVFAYVRFFR